MQASSAYPRQAERAVQQIGLVRERRSKCLFAMVLLTLCEGAYADSATETPVVQTQERVGTVYSAVSVVSDYRYNGVSESDRHSALQGYLHLARTDGYFAGVFASQVDFNDPHNTNAELDTYVGRNFYFGNTELKLQAMYSSFNERVPGPTYDFLQLKVRVAHQLGTVNVAIASAWTPEGSYGAGSTWQLRSEFDYKIFEGIHLSATAGRSVVDHRADRSYWDLGVTASWRSFNVDVRYGDTTSNLRQCGYTDWCAASFVAKLEAALPPLRL